MSMSESVTCRRGSPISADSALERGWGGLGQGKGGRSKHNKDDESYQEDNMSLGQGIRGVA